MGRNTLIAPNKEKQKPQEKQEKKGINWEEYGDDLLPRKGQRWPY